MGRVGRTNTGIAYAVDGHAVGDVLPVLLVHGHLDDRHALADVRAMIGDRHVAALDLPWHGASSAPIDANADILGTAIIDVLDDLGWSQCLVIGHAVGATAALLAAVSASHRFAGLLLVSVLGDLADHDRQRLLNFAGFIDEEGAGRWLAILCAALWFSEEWVVLHPELTTRLEATFARNIPMAAAACCRALASSSPMQPALPTLRGVVDVTVVAGTEDLVTPPGRVADVVAALGARLIELQAGHYPFEEQAVAFREIVQTFLARFDGARRRSSPSS